MLENHRADLEPGIATLVEGILADTQKLFRQEIALAQREIAQEWDKGKTAVAWLSGALVAFGVGGVLLGFTLAKLLHQYLLPNHEWACFAISFGLFALLGGALVYRARNEINGVHVEMPQTVSTLSGEAQADGAVSPAGRSSLETFLKR